MEQRAQEAILKSIVENYKQKNDDWMKNPDVRKALFNKAFFKPANAAIIAGTILATGCVSLLVLPLIALTAPIWSVLGALGALGIGLITEVIYLYMAVTNEKAHAKAVSDMLSTEVDFDPKTIKDRELQASVEKALEYWALIDDTVEQVPDGALHESLENTTREMTHWLQAVYNLANRVDKFRDNKVIKRDLKAVPKTIEDYKARLSDEDSEEVRNQMKKTIADQERQLRTLQSLEDNMEKASYQLESTISSLGTIYSQLLLVGSKDESGSKVNRLQSEISEQVHHLEDLTEAMDEVYQSSY